MCSQFNSSSSSSLMVLPKCNFLSSRHILHFQDECQNSSPQDTQEAQLAQNQEDHRQQDTHHQQQQQEDNNKKEEEELFKDNVKDYNNNKSSTVNSQVKSDKGGVYTDLTSTFKKDNIRDYNNNKSSTVISQVESDEGRVYTDLTSTLKKDNVKDYSKIIIPTSPKHVSSTTQMLICPPAPKKKKTIQVTKRSRLHHHDQEERVFLDVYDEIESLFPPALLADLDNKIKKARKITPIL